MRFANDTIINDLMYKKIHRTSDSLQAKWEVIGYIREDTLGRVYKLLQSNESEVMLFDYSLQKGDSLNSTPTLYIDSVQIKPFGYSDTLRKHYYINGAVWVEGVGSLSGPLFGVDLIYMAGLYFQLLCYFESDQLVYSNPKYSSCFPVSTEMFGVLRHYLHKFTSNSFAHFQVESINTQGAEFQVLNIMGKTIYSRKLVGLTEWEVPLTGLPPGIYIYRLRTAGGVLAGKFYAH